VKFHQQLHKFLEQMPVFGPICKKTANFTPDLSKKDIALRMIGRAINLNYCAYSALQSDPLLVKLRGIPKFSELVSAAKECRKRALAVRD
jgi:hypothetical protein